MVSGMETPELIGFPRILSIGNKSAFDLIIVIGVRLVGIKLEGEAFWSGMAYNNV